MLMLEDIQNRLDRPRWGWMGLLESPLYLRYLCWQAVREKYQLQRKARENALHTTPTSHDNNTAFEVAS